MLESLIKKAEEVKKEGKEVCFEIEVKRFKELGIEGNIKVVKPDTSILTSFMERRRDMTYLLGECMVEPDLSTEELRKAYGANSSKDLVGKMLTKEELTDIGNLLGDLIRDNKSISLVEKSVDDIKN